MKNYCAELKGWLDDFRAETDYAAWTSDATFHHMFHQLESEVLYSLVRGSRPTRVIEVGPNHGFTTFILLKALAMNDQPASLLSFDTLPNSACLDCAGTVSRKLIVGDAREMVWDMVVDCDFLFIDAEHSYDFGQWYCETLVPKVPLGKYVWIHDWDEVRKAHIEDEGHAVDEHALLTQPPLLAPVVNTMAKYEEWTGKVADWRGTDGQEDRTELWYRERSPSQILVRV